MYLRSLSIGFAVALNTFAVTGCNVPPYGDRPPSCEPGETRLCTYTQVDESFDGKQICDKDGIAWGECGPLSLPETGTGGGGQGGGTGTGGSIPVSELVVVQPVDQIDGTALAPNAQEVLMLKVDFDAKGEDQPIDTLRFTHFDLGPNQDITSVKVYNNVLQSVPCLFDVQSGIATCHGLNYTVSGGKRGYVLLYVSFANAKKNGLHGWEIKNASDVILVGSGKVTGLFPIDGHMFHISDQP